MRVVDLAGEKFGRLTVTIRAVTPKRGVFWKCVCSCGEKIVVYGGNLRSGNTKSCGCLNIENVRDRTRLKYPWIVSKNALILQYKVGANRRNYSFELSDEECHSLFSSSCNYCGLPPANTINAYLTKAGDKRNPGKNLLLDEKQATYLFNGIDRIDNTKGYFYKNCVACCKICNTAKANLPKKEFMSWVYRLAQHKTIIVYRLAQHKTIITEPVADFDNIRKVSYHILVYRYKKGAKRRNYHFDLSNEECHRLFKGRCNYCGVDPFNTINAYLRKDGQPNALYRATGRPKNNLEEATYLYNGIDRVDPAQGYQLKNKFGDPQCVSCCTTCNVAKNNLRLADWNTWVSRIVKFNRK